MTDGEKKDNIALVISGKNCEQGFMIGSVPMEDGTSNSIAAAALDTLLDWNLVPEICGMVFDTTSSNTGWLNGAASKIEIMLNR